jgi:hypothetical protein
MKQFNHLLEALSFRTHCPVCRARLQANGRDLVTEYDITNPDARIAFELSNSDDILYIDPRTEKVELVLTDRKPQFSLGNHPSVTGAYAGGTPNSSYHTYHGIFGHSMTIDCDKCCQYSYTLQIWADLVGRRLTSILLNSEMISWDDEDGVTHEIVSSYASNKTRYSYFASDGTGDDDHISLPLIPVDVNNPKDAVLRIKNLIVFS